MNAQSLSPLLEQVAAWAWHTSLAAALPLGVLLLFGRWRNFPARIRLVLGMLVMIRLLMPVVPSIPGHPAKWLGQARPAALATPEPLPAMQTLALGPEAAAMPLPVPAGTAVSPPRSLLPWLTGIWALGAVGVLGWVGRSHWVLHRMIQQASAPADPALRPHLMWARQRMNISREVGLLEVQGLPTVALWGWRKPHILVPRKLVDSYSVDEIRGMLLHELAHIRRHDVLWTWLGLAACSLHWFNPLSWLALRRIRADRELECDRLALERLSDPQRRSYGHALLKTLESQLAPSLMALVPFGQKHPDIKVRIHMITTPLPLSWLHRLTPALLPALALFTFTTAEADGEADKKADPEAAPKEITKPREGDREKTNAPRDGEIKREGPRDGEGRRNGPRDGEGKRTGPRDGEEAKKGPRDGEEKKTGLRDGEGKRTGPRDGEEAKKGPRDGEEKRRGPRDGDGKKAGLREGDQAKFEGAKTAEGLTVNIQGDGTLTMDKGVVTHEQLLAKLQTLAGGGHDRPVVLRTASSTSYKNVLEVLELCKQAGIVNVAFAQREL